MISEATKVAAVWALLNDGRVGDILDTLDGDARERDLQDWLWYYDTTLDACPPMPLAQALGEGCRAPAQGLVALVDLVQQVHPLRQRVTSRTLSALRHCASNFPSCERI